MNYQIESKQMFKDQLKDWSLFADNWEGLKEVKLKSFHFDAFDINVQFNPKRIVSSAAKVDTKSIAERKCFLCSKNRPDVQTEIIWEDRFEILVNPFPIFNEHYTISSNKHEDQAVGVEFKNMLKLSKDLNETVLFYNAPKCGASAPDHMHFQAGNLGFLPIEDDWANLKNKYAKNLSTSPEIEVLAVDDSLRKYLVLESDNSEKMDEVFQKIHDFSQELEKGEAPMLNMLSYFIDGKYRVFIFIRGKHRPWQYFEEGDKNILLSPASVDMGGTLITPLEKDFNKITKEDIIDIFEQISISKENFEDLKDYISINA